jgi:two-component system, probable response regulator PhcQ
MNAATHLEPVHTVLVVDDDEDVLAIIGQVLNQQGLRVIATSDAREVLALIAADSNVAVLISDVDMPRLSGIDLVLAVKKANPEIVRVMLTGSVSMAPVLRAINEGEVFRYLTKPCSAADLVTVVRAALELSVRNRRAVAAEVQVSRRAARVAELERAWPGISAVSPPEVGHVLPAAALAALERERGVSGPLLVAAVLADLATP